MSFPIEKSGDVKKWMKRKRTRRHCNINSISQPPPAPVVTSSTSSSADFSGITTEEEEIDLANSLILLSQGGNSKDQVVVGTLSDTTTSQPPPPPPPVKIEKIEKPERTHKSAQPNNGNNSEHTCKTCFKRFNSFQALGGHRASHKKPKLASDDHQKKKVQSPPSADTNATSGVNLKLDDHDHITTNYKEEAIQVDSKIGKSPGKVRVHACQICHAEFSTGQALGGHMRRHKPLNGGAPDLSKNKKDRSGGLELDLNFPPSDQDETVQPTAEVFPFEGDPPTKLLLGSSALTNCSLY